MADYELTYPQGTVTFEPVDGTEAPHGLDTGKLLATTGRVAYDPGFVNTASTKSAITFIDGGAGILRYRGYPIAELAEKASFLETSYLLLYGELPTQAELDAFTAKIREQMLLPDDLTKIFAAFPRDAHPMPVLSAAVNALGTFYQDDLDPFDDEQVERSTLRLLAKVPTIVAYAHKHNVGEPSLYPDTSLGYAENFLRMAFGLPSEQYEVDPVVAKVLDMLFILHADHEQNCSTSSVRLVGSSHANIFSSIASGVNALFGPLHGGANQQVIEMLGEIHASGDDVSTFMNRVKNKEPGVRLMGFGHRVYKSYDPRAAIVKQATGDVLKRLGKPDPLLDIAMKLEETALADDYFIQRNLYPNVDFYTGILYKAMGFPTEMFTALFAIGRMPGWLAHWREGVKDPENKIGRPRQVYTGPTERSVTDIKNR